MVAFQAVAAQNPIPVELAAVSVVVVEEQAKAHPLLTGVEQLEPRTLKLRWPVHDFGYLRQTRPNVHVREE